jgi:hypothetical protein
MDDFKIGVDNIEPLNINEIMTSKYGIVIRTKDKLITTR